MFGNCNTFLLSSVSYKKLRVYKKPSTSAKKEQNLRSFLEAATKDVLQKDVLKNFAKFIGKHSYQSLFFRVIL